jgi:hypothetical protein
VSTEHRGTFTKNNMPPLIRFLSQGPGTNETKFYNDSKNYNLNIYLEHSEIAEMSNEIESVDHNAKSQKDSSNDSSESNESDYIEDVKNNYHVGVVASTTGKPQGPNAKKSLEKNVIDQN